MLLFYWKGFSFFVVFEALPRFNIVVKQLQIPLWSVCYVAVYKLGVLNKTTNLFKSHEYYNNSPCD